MAWLPIYRGHGKAARVVAFTVLDDDDYAMFKDRRWNLKDGYAQSRAYTNGNCDRIWLHRAILGLPNPKESSDDREADHVDRDRLNNRRSNLRVLRHCENRQNVSSAKGSSSKYRGVYLKSAGKWRAYCKVDGKFHHLGYYTTEEEAAKVVSDYRETLMPFANENRRVA